MNRDDVYPGALVCYAMMADPPAPVYRVALLRRTRAALGAWDYRWLEMADGTPYETRSAAAACAAGESLLADYVAWAYAVVMCDRPATGRPRPGRRSDLPYSVVIDAGCIFGVEAAQHPGICPSLRSIRDLVEDLYRHLPAYATQDNPHVDPPSDRPS